MQRAHSHSVLQQVSESPHSLSSSFNPTSLTSMTPQSRVCPASLSSEAPPDCPMCTRLVPQAMCHRRWSRSARRPRYRWPGGIRVCTADPKTLLITPTLFRLLVPCGSNTCAQAKVSFSSTPSLLATPSKKLASSTSKFSESRTRTRSRWLSSRTSPTSSMSVRLAWMVGAQLWLLSQFRTLIAASALPPWQRAVTSPSTLAANSLRPRPSSASTSTRPSSTSSVKFVGTTR